MDRSRKIRRASFVGLIFGVPALFVGWIAVAGSEGSGWHILAPFAGLAAALCAALLWYFWILSRKNQKRWQGALAGGLVCLIAHPVAWYLLILYNFFFGEGSSLGDDPIGPIDGLWGAFVFSFWSLLFYGWLTLPIGAICGALLIRRSR